MVPGAFESIPSTGMVPEAFESIPFTGVVQLKERLGKMVRGLIRSEEPAGIVRKAAGEVYQEGPDNPVSDLELWIGMRKRESKTVIKESEVRGERALPQ